MSKRKPFEGVSVPPSSSEVSDEVLRDRWGMDAVAVRRRAEELVETAKTMAFYTEVYYAIAWLRHYGHPLTDRNIIAKSDRMARHRQRIANFYDDTKRDE